MAFISRPLNTILIAGFFCLTAMHGGMAMDGEGDLMASVPTPVQAPRLDMPRIDGSRFSLDDRKGKFTIINFWALWCEPCRVEMPALGRLKSSLVDQDIEIIAINLGDHLPAINRFLKRVKTGPLTIVLDTASRANTDWHLQGLPATFVVGPDGTITHAAFGAREWDSADGIRWLRDALRSPRQN